MAPVDVAKPYTFLSSEPTYSMDPSTLRAGDERTLPPVALVHNTVPAEEKAYMFLSSLPTKTLPEAAITGDDWKKLVEV
jgi:hypothetical protein